MCRSQSLIRQCFDRNIKDLEFARGLGKLLRGAEIIRMAIDISQEEDLLPWWADFPWRMLLSKDGQVKIIGYAIPQIEMLVFRDDQSDAARGSFRYAPPERINPGEVEDDTSDLFSLVLVAFELITMQPMYDGTVSEIQEMAQRADVAMRLSSGLMDGVYSREVFDFFQRASF